MALPVTKVEIAFDSGFATAEGSRTWTDVTAYVEGNEAISINYGRADELSAAEPNQCTVTFDNRDGRFTPEKTTGAYYPNVKKGKPLRVTVTYNSIDYVRFTGYVDEWPLVWPDGSSSASTVTVSATSRKARLGITAVLPYSPIRTAYLATDPLAYWPMDDDIISSQGRSVFRDITNYVNINNTAKGSLAAFTDTSATSIKPYIHDGTPGPTDEESLVHFPSFSSMSDIDTKIRYIGAGGAYSAYTAGEITLEAAFRVNVGNSADDGALATVADIWSSDGTQRLTLALSANDSSDREVVGTLALYDVDGSLIGIASSGNTTTTAEEYANFDATADGTMHHLALSLSPNGGNTDLKAYLDGVQMGSTLTFSTPVPQRFNQILVGPNTWNADLWVGHVAIHDRALTAAEILDHATAAVAIDETDAERVIRIAGRLGVPAGEIDAETSVALPLGQQPEKDRTAGEVLDELAASTNGIIYDTRAGRLAYQARNHRYNDTADFSLSATAQEIEGDLTAILDDRYLWNTIELTRTSASEDLARRVTDDTSIDDYGVYSKSLTIVSSSDEEVIAAGRDQLYRYKDPKVRVSQVSVDLLNLSTSQRALVLAADIGTLFNITSLPSQAPVDPMPLYLEGYTETITTTSHALSMNTTPGGLYTNVAILDDASHDVLGSGITLAY